MMAPGSPTAGDPAPVRTGVSPVTKAARHAQIAAILTRAAVPVRSQEDLAEQLARRGVRVTQATLSRDLEEIGAVRLRGADGALVYALPGPPGGPGSRPGGLSAGPARGENDDYGSPAASAAEGGAAGGGVAGSGAAGDEPGSGRAATAGPAGPAGPGGPGGDGAGADGAGAGPADDGAALAAGWPAGGLSTGEAGLRRVAAELLLAAEASANLVVLRTPAGAAQFLASVIDHAGWPSVLGTVAGDDTVLVIARDPVGGHDLAGALLDLAERRGHRTAGPHRNLNREADIPARRES
jgi:arginine repressor